MVGGAWRAAAHGVTRVGYDLATKPPPYIVTCHGQIVTVLDAFPVWVPFISFPCLIVMARTSSIIFLEKHIYFWPSWGFVAVYGLPPAAASRGCPALVRGLLIAALPLIAEHRL